MNLQRRDFEIKKNYKFSFAYNKDYSGCSFDSLYYLKKTNRLYPSHYCRSGFDRRHNLSGGYNASRGMVVL